VLRGYPIESVPAEEVLAAAGAVVAEAREAVGAW
jgi:hypothetical protein